jgi:hypothetical protein
MGDSVMDFSLNNYIGYSNTRNYFPKNIFPFVSIDKNKYKELEKIQRNNKNSVGIAFIELQKRVSEKYFQKVYPAQSSALNFSQRSFPPYRFLLMEILADDWLSIVDWHKKHCRDHALHQPLTAYIVHKLLGGGISSKSLKIGNSNLLDLSVSNILQWGKSNYIKEYLLDIGVNPKSALLKDTPIGRVFWKNLFYETALVAAIFHDMGYPWQYINRLNHNLNTADFSSNNSITNAEHIYDCFKNRLILYPFNGYKSINKNVPCNWEKELLQLISTSLSKTHGFPGALGFLYLNDFIREFPPKKEQPFHQFSIDWASLGIMMHDFKDIYHGVNNDSPPDNSHMRLEFDKDPLSCIISLADVLEEFERPNVLPKPNKLSSNLKYNSHCKSSEIYFDNGELNITYKFDTSKAAAEKRVYMQKDEYEYFNPDLGYLDFSSIGIRKVNMYAIK